LQKVTFLSAYNIDRHKLYSANIHCLNYRFNFLKYSEIKPDWWICNKNIDEDSGSETSNSYQVQIKIWFVKFNILEITSSK